MRTIKLNTSYKFQFLIALAISLWLVVFLILIAPFDVAELPFWIRVEILPLYGLISFISYSLLIPIQHWVYKTIGKWNLLLEVSFILVFNTLTFIGSYMYYKSSIINGEYSFAKFALEVYTPILIILLFILVLARWFVNTKMPNKEHPKIILTGENKRDFLQIQLEHLVAVSSADNYVEIHYIKENAIKKKLLRNTLKNIQNQEPSLQKVHRSHLINLFHFKEWKNTNTILVHEIEIPVSKNYRQAILAIDFSSLKTYD
ncbi:LytTR family DNA-binding domain-containing protein [Flavobacteriaceae bacterium S356]|uniref:LytTR family DNA-binding domain-containing protein n=1 Tax=Asprobacillus argus TaxID=3076534 RepID=A0ABU3LGZ5_9FLAO|nr:LytTR family DNA-binding domain-containing protein [Flavobacteriaceae bacterium S356]